MKTLAILLVLTGLSIFAQGQVGCPSYSSSTQAFDTPSDTNGHVTGNHAFTGAAEKQCTYWSNGTNYQYCASTAAVYMAVGTSETGTITTWPIGYHVSNYSTTDATQTTQDGGATQANGVGVAAWVYCLTSSCAFTVTSNPISVPSPNVWAHTQLASVICATISNPAYVPPPPPCTGCGTCTGCRPDGCSSPVVIDLLDEGMHFTSLKDGVQFDLNGDGKPLFLSWTDPNYHNAWLALDRNHNGTIDSAQELFGYLTEPQLPSPDGQRTGWLALAVYDQPEYGGNGDGVIDAKDAIYPYLLLWIDSNHDGISQPNELHHLAEMGVTSIPLKYTHKSYKDENGNNFRFENFVGIRQEHHQAWDVVLDATEVLPGGSSSPSPDVLCRRTPAPSKYFLSYNGTFADLPFPFFNFSADFADVLGLGGKR